MAANLKVSRAALRSDLAVLTMSGLLGARPRVGYYLTGKDSSDVLAGLLGNIRVGNVQSIPIVIRENQSVYDAIVNMFISDVGTLFVVSTEGFLEGLVSRKDLLKTTIGSQNINELPISVIMTRMPNLIVTTPDESVLRAAEKLLSHQVDAMPVVEVAVTPTGEKYNVVGRFSKTNITRLFVSLAGS